MHKKNCTILFLVVLACGSLLLQVPGFAQQTDSLQNSEPAPVIPAPDFSFPPSSEVLANIVMVPSLCKTDASSSSSAATAAALHAHNGLLTVTAKSEEERKQLMRLILMGQLGNRALAARESNRIDLKALKLLHREGDLLQSAKSKPPSVAKVPDPAKGFLSASSAPTMSEPDPEPQPEPDPIDVAPAQAVPVPTGCMMPPVLASPPPPRHYNLGSRTYNIHFKRDDVEDHEQVGRLIRIVLLAGRGLEIMGDPHYDHDDLKRTIGSLHAETKKLKGPK